MKTKNIFRVRLGNKMDIYLVAGSWEMAMNKAQAVPTVQFALRRECTYVFTPEFCWSEIYVQDLGSAHTDMEPVVITLSQGQEVPQVTN